MMSSSSMSRSRKILIHVSATGLYMVWLALIFISVPLGPLQLTLFLVTAFFAVAILIAIIRPQAVLSVFCAVTFIVYIPVAILDSNVPLLILDILLGIGLIQTFAMQRKGRFRILGGSRLVAICLALYVCSVLLGLINDNTISWVNAVQGMRTWLFGMGFLVLSSARMNSSRAVDGFLKVFLLGSLFAALYGLRQFAVGLVPFEYARLITGGSLAIEILYAKLTRIPSSLSMPTAFAFAMLTAVLLLPALRLPQIRRKAVRRIYLLGLGSLLLVGLLISSMRGPLLALAVAVVFIFLVQRRRISTKLVKILLLVAVIVAFANIALSYDFAQSDNALIRSTGKVIESALSAIPLPITDTQSERQRGMAIGIASRLRQMEEFIPIIVSHPFGVGVGTVTTKQGILNFEAPEIGYLRIMAETGWFGLIAYLGIFLSIPWVAYRKLKSISNKYVVVLGYQLLGLWVAYGVATATGWYLETEISSGVAWIVAGILLNLDVIALSEQGVMNESVNPT